MLALLNIDQTNTNIANNFLVLSFKVTHVCQLLGGGGGGQKNFYKSV